METILKLVVVVFLGIAVIGVIVATALVNRIRENRVLYRVIYIILAVCALIGIPLMTYLEFDDIGIAGAITLNVLSIPFMLIVIVYNKNCIEMEKNEKPVISTLENCTVDRTTSDDRVYMWIEGTSREGRKSKFKIEFLSDQVIVDRKEVTPDTVFTFEYYESNDSLVSVKREN